MPPWKKWKLEREEKKRREEEERRRKEEEERERTRQMLKKYGPAMLGFLTVLVLITVPLGIRSERQKNEVAAVNDLTRSAIVLSEQDRSPADKTDAPETGGPPEDAPADEPAPERGAEQDDGTQPQDGAGPEQDGAEQTPPDTGTQSAPGTGGSTDPDPAQKPQGTSNAAAQAPPPNVSAGTTYVLNTNSMKFHKPYCSSAKKISAGNRWEFTGTRDEVTAMGYEPCKNCNP